MNYWYARKVGLKTVDCSPSRLYRWRRVVRDAYRYFGVRHLVRNLWIYWMVP